MSVENRTVPTELKQCFQTCEAAYTLSNIAENVLKWGKVVLIIILAGGLILSMFSCGAAKEMHDSKPFLVFLQSMLTWGIVAFIEWVTYYILAWVLEAIATIAHNTSVAANVALYEAGKKEKA